MTHYAHVFSVDRLGLAVHLGIYDDERARPQPVEISLRIYFPAKPTFTADDNAPFIDYAGLVEAVRMAATAREFRLLEFMAQEMFNTAVAYLEKHSTQQGTKLWLKLTKSAPPVDGLKGGASFTLSNLPADATATPL